MVFCVLCCWSCRTNFEIGQTFRSKQLPSFLLSSDRRSVAQQCWVRLRSSFNSCWGDARALHVVSLNIIYVCHSIDGSCTLPLTPSNNSQHSRANTVGSFSNVLRTKQSSYIQTLPFSRRLAPASESPLSPWSFSCFTSGLSPIFLNQNITTPFIDVQELSQSQANFTLALSLKGSPSLRHGLVSWFQSPFVRTEVLEDLFKSLMPVLYHV